MTNQQIFDTLADNECKLFYALCADRENTELRAAHEAAKKALSDFSMATGCRNTTSAPADENKALLEKMFYRYGRPSDEAVIELRGYFSKADDMNETDRIQRNDASAVRLIQECEAVIAQLTAYRISLTERYNFLSVAPSLPVVRLERDKNSWTGKVHYHLRFLRRFLDDGTEVEEEKKTYPGTERRKAISDFNAYKKAHPGITAEMDIEKRPWER